MIRDTFLEPLLWWAFSAVAVTGVFCGIYLAVQQNYRQSLNDPQIQIAEDAAAVLQKGGVPAEVVVRGPLVDLRNSLATWVAVYDATGLALEASGQLDNAPPKIPAGLFNPSSWIDQKTWVTPLQQKETRVTWQPDPGVRQAAVAVRVERTQGDEYVVVGRNMREQENRVSQLGSNLLIGWSFTLGCLFILSIVGWWLLKRRA